MKKLIFGLSLLLVSTLTVFSQIPTEGLVGYWSFSGNAQDESGNNLHGTVDGATLVNDRFGIPNSSYSFNYTKITIPDNNLLDFTNQFSLCTWFNSSDISTHLVQGILGKLRYDGGCGYYIQLANSGDLYGEQPDYPGIIFGIDSGTSPYGGNCYYHSDSLLIGWHFIVGTYNGESIKLYVDGKLQDSVPTSVILPNSGYPLYIGRECGNVDAPVPSGDTIRYFFGEVDDVRLYNRPFSLMEITLLYNESKLYYYPRYYYRRDI